MANKFYFFLALAAALPFSGAYGKDISKNTAQMQAMDKITGRVSIIEVPVGGEIKFGSFSVVVRSCLTRPEGEVPENFAFVDVSDKSFDEKEYNIFKGWMFSSKPAVNAVEHPIYDVWLLKCTDGTPDAVTLLSEQALAKRDELPRLHDIRQEQKSLHENQFEIIEKENIHFKDSMYKDAKEPRKPENLPEPKVEGAPENLLNIKGSYEDIDEDLVTIDADDLSQALDYEQKQLSKMNETVIDNELSSAIDEELSLQNE